MATDPRQILPGRSWFITGRAILRQHRFVPSKDITRTIWYCLAVVSQKYQVQLHGFTWMSNHYHLALTDRCAQLPDFMRDLNALISKAINAVRGVRGENFARIGYNAVIIADGARLLRHCAYTEANPSRAHLVERAQQWSGVTSAKLEYGEEITLRRPKTGLWKRAAQTGRGKIDPSRASYRGRITCPATARLRLEPPPCRNGKSAAETRAEVRKLVKNLEDTARLERKSQNTSVVGMRAVRRVQYKSSPSTPQDYFGKVPRVSGEIPGERAIIRRRLQEFVNLYRQALEEYKRSGKASFPEGTWWMRRCLNKQCYSYCPIE